MKKNSKLVLKRETIRTLVGSELEGVGGGTATTAPMCTLPVPAAAVKYRMTTAITCGHHGTATTAINCTVGPATY
jgi:hypothetical protein